MLTCIESMKLDTGSCSSVTNRTVRGKKGSVPSTTLHGIRNAYIRRSRSADRRYSTCALGKTAREAIRNGLASIISASTSRECTITRISMSC